MQSIRAFLAFALLSAVATPALAQSTVDGTANAGSLPPAGNNPDADALSKDRVTIGVGAAYLPDYEGSNDYEFTPFPAVLGSVHGYNFQLIGNRASIDIIRNQPGPTWDFQLGPVGSVNLNRDTNSSVSDLRVRALGKRGIGVELGGYIGLGKTGVITSPYDKLSVSVSYRHDVTNANGSYQIAPSITYFTPLSRKMAIMLFGSATNVGNGYAQNYFSVTPLGSQASGLPVYYAHGGWKDWTGGLIFTHSLTGDLTHGLSLVAGGVYRKLLNDFAATPITSIAGSRNQWTGALGVAYTF